MARATSDADIVHTHHMRSAPSRLAALLAARRGQHAVVTDHGLGGGGWGGILPRLFQRFCVVSRYSARTLNAPPGKTRIVFGGADPDRFFPDSGGRDGLLYVGRITPHKGLDRLIQALPDDAELRIAGSAGHDRKRPESDYPELLAKLARGKRVTWLGAVADRDLPELYRRARAFVLPTVERTCYGRSVAIPELLGLSAIEAMASGTPVVCSRTGGLPEVVRDGETGLTVPPGDVDALRAALYDVLGNREATAVMGKAARDLTREEFTWDKCALRCLDAYSEFDGNGAA